MTRAGRFAVGILLASIACPLAAAPDDGISVVGRGEVAAMPDTVELHGRLSGSAELSSDAIVKFLDSKRRVLSAFAKLQFKNLKLHFGGVSISTNPEGSGATDLFLGAANAAAPAPRAHIEFASTVRLTLSGIQNTPEEELMQTVSQLVDKLHDAGVAVVQPGGEDLVQLEDPGSDGSGEPVAVFVLENTPTLRERAYEQAFASARASAERLAKLAGVRLGRVLAVQEPMDAAVMVGAESPADPNKLRLASRKFAAIPVRAALEVRFEIGDERRGDTETRRIDGAHPVISRVEGLAR